MELQFQLVSKVPQKIACGSQLTAATVCCLPVGCTWSVFGKANGKHICTGTPTVCFLLSSTISFCFPTLLSVPCLTVWLHFVSCRARLKATNWLETSFGKEALTSQGLWTTSRCPAGAGYWIKLSNYIDIYYYLDYYIDCHGISYL